MPERRMSEQITHSSSKVSRPEIDPSACFELSGKFAKGPTDCTFASSISACSPAILLSISFRSESNPVWVSLSVAAKRRFSSSKRVLSPLCSSSQACDHQDKYGQLSLVW